MTKLRNERLLAIFAILVIVIKSFISIQEGSYNLILYILNMLAPLLAVIVLNVVVRSHTKRINKTFWTLMTIGAACEFIAQMIWGSYEVFRSVEAPEISIADLFWMCESILYLAALFVWLESTRERKRYIIDSMAIIISISIIFWEYVMKPAVFNEESMYILLVDMFYPVTSIIMIFVTSVWLLNGERRMNRATIGILTLGFLLCASGDLFYVVLIDVYKLEAWEPVIDSFWSCAVFCFAAAGLLSSQDLPGKNSLMETIVGRIIRFSSPYIGLVLLVGNLLVERQIDLATEIGLLLTIGIIFTRQVLLFLEREKLLDQLRTALEQSNYLANHDSLTGILNRRKFEEELTRAISNAKTSKGKVALLFFDLDKFKPVNDQYGHSAGDLLLKLVVDRLKPLHREGIQVARFGGDEFGICIEHGDDLAHVEEVAQWIIMNISQPFDLQGCTIHTSSSVGISLYPDHSQTMKELLHHADQAMYQAKISGGNRFIHFSGG